MKHYKIFHRLHILPLQYTIVVIIGIIFHCIIVHTYLYANSQQPVCQNSPGWFSDQICDSQSSCIFLFGQVTVFKFCLLQSLLYVYDYYTLIHHNHNMTRVIRNFVLSNMNLNWPQWLIFIYFAELWFSAIDCTNWINTSLAQLKIITELKSNCSPIQSQQCVGLVFTPLKRNVYACLIKHVYTLHAYITLLR